MSKRKLKFVFKYYISRCVNIEKFSKYCKAIYSMQ